MQATDNPWYVCGGTGFKVSGGTDVPLSEHQNALEAMRLTEIRRVENKKRPSSPIGVFTTCLKAAVLVTDVGVSVFVWVLCVGFVFLFWECCSFSFLLGAKMENMSMGWMFICLLPITQCRGALTRDFLQL